MRICKRIAALLGMAVGVAAVYLAFFFDRVFSSAPGFFHWGGWRDYAFVIVVASLGLAVIVVAYCFGFRWGSEPAASPNGGPSTRSGSPEAGGEPPSVS